MSIFLPVKVNASDIDEPHLNLISEAQLLAKPDFISISLHIEETDTVASKAKKIIDNTSQQVLALAKRFKIKDEHIDAAEIRIYPEYRWHDNERQLIGQKVQRQIDIKLYQLDQYTDFVNNIALLKITRYQQQGYGFDDLAKLQTQALLKALDKSQEKAQLIAGAINRKLGKVYAVNELSHQQHFSMDRASKALGAESSAAPLKVSEQAIKAKVNVIYLLK